MDTTSEFSIYTFSNTKKSINNTLSNFTTYLPNTINLNNNNYYVALEEIGFNYTPNVLIDMPKEKVPYFWLCFSLVTKKEESIITKEYLNSMDITIVYEDENKYLILVPIWGECLNSLNDIIRQYLCIKMKMIVFLKKYHHIKNGLDEHFPIQIYISDKKELVVEAKYNNIYGNIAVLAHIGACNIFNFSTTEKVFFIDDNSFHVLLSIVIDNQYQIIRSAPISLCKAEFLTLKCDCIKPSIHHEKQTNILRQFQVPMKPQFFVHEFENLEFIPLLKNSIDRISFQLENQCENLKLNSGTPTYLKLKFRQINETMFNVHLTSEDSQYYPKNKPHNFTVQLPKTLELDTSWEVGLTSINFPKEMYFSKLPNIIIKHGIDLTEQLTIEIPPFTKKVETIIEILNDVIQIYNLGNVKIENGKFKATLLTNCSIIIPHPLTIILGLQKNVFSKETITLSIFEPSDIRGEHLLEEMKSIYHPPYFMVYTNIIDEVITGETYSKLLRIVHWEKDDIIDGRVNKEFKHKNFFKLNETIIPSIHVEIRTVDGNYINLDENEPIILNLEFKKNIL